MKGISEIVEAIADMIQVIADNPASILIVLGFISILLAVFIPITNWCTNSTWRFRFLYANCRDNSSCNMASKVTCYFVSHIDSNAVAKMTIF